jgi:hypothetical protein
MTDWRKGSGAGPHGRRRDKGERRWRRGGELRRGTTGGGCRRDSTAVRGHRGGLDDGKQAMNDEEGDSSDVLNEHGQCHDVGAAGTRQLFGNRTWLLALRGRCTATPGMTRPW